MFTAALETCPVCGGREFSRQSILWQGLIDEWTLSREQVDYINLQQGLTCTGCNNNLRAMTLGAALTRTFGFAGTLEDFCRNNTQVRNFRVVEINPAGHLTPLFNLLPRHELHSFPSVNMEHLAFESDSIDLLIHSDTLEHVFDSLIALKECRRVLKSGGHLFYTVPIIKERLTKNRRGLPPSYHGAPGTFLDDFKVETEYGADFWCEVFQAGFENLQMTTLIFPASIAIHTVK